MIVEATFSCLWILPKICDWGTLERCWLYAEWRHLAGNNNFDKQQYAAVKAKNNFRAYVNNCPCLRTLQRSMAQKPYWRKLHTSLKLFDHVKVLLCLLMDANHSKFDYFAHLKAILTIEKTPTPPSFFHPIESASKRSQHRPWWASFMFDAFGHCVLYTAIRDCSFRLINF